jgi:hypothetical protein
MQAISPFQWFDVQAEEAAQFYVGIFPRSRIKRVLHYGEAGQEAHGQKGGVRRGRQARGKPLDRGEPYRAAADALGPADALGAHQLLCFEVKPLSGGDSRWRREADILQAP